MEYEGKGGIEDDCRFFIRAVGKMELPFIEIENGNYKADIGTREAFAFKVGGGAACIYVNGNDPLT